MRFFSCSSVKLYFGVCATVSIVYEFKKKLSYAFHFGEMTYILQAHFETLRVEPEFG